LYGHLVKFYNGESGCKIVFLKQLSQI